MDVCGEDTVTLISREVAGDDRYGNQVLVDTEVTLPYCSIQPMWGQEDINRADLAIDRFRLFIPGSAWIDLQIDPTMLDAVRFNGITYEVNGEPQPWRLHGVIDHAVVYLRHVTG
jgi:hypothetical protein